MKAIILGAGYATRLYPLTKDFPKPLLKVQGISILDRLIVKLQKIPEIDQYIVVSNDKFFNIFDEWKQTKDTLKDKIIILNDGSTCNENRLGAVKDIFFAIEQCNICDDIIVLAGDNVLDFDIKEFTDYFKLKKHACIMRHFESEKSKLCKTGVIVIDSDDKVLQMQEKPSEPKSSWAVPPFYIYPKSSLNDIAQGIEQGCPVDAPGDFISWYCKNHTVYAWQMSGKRYDIGDLNSFEAVQKVELSHECN